ncbi:DUF6207 family protein [Streptomyces sp. NPDC020597]|uniref:DUF6207 family protein n=1 Tax=Streptomyces sp. NPDC020597 TaxID=3365080 RepID=UPI00378C62CC
MFRQASRNRHGDHHVLISVLTYRQKIDTHLGSGAPGLSRSPLLPAHLAVPALTAGEVAAADDEPAFAIRELLAVSTTTGAWRYRRRGRPHSGRSGHRGTRRGTERSTAEPDG